MTEHPNGQIMISHIPEEYSQNPEHIDHIAGNTFFKDFGKLNAKIKLADNFGPSLFILRNYI